MPAFFYNLRLLCPGFRSKRKSFLIQVIEPNTEIENIINHKEFGEV